MHRQRHRAGRAVRRHRRVGHGSRHRVGRRLRHRQRRRRRHLGSYRRHHRRGGRLLPGHLAGRWDRRVGDHRDVPGDLAQQPRRDAAACCRARHHRGGGHRGGAHRDVAQADAEWAGPPAALRRTGCCPPAVYVPPASGPGADRVLVRGELGRVSDRPAVVREPEQAVRPAQVPAAQPVWGRRLSAPPGSRLWLRVWQPPRRCRWSWPVRACRRRTTHATDALPALPPSTMRI
jgi:hypothetical protein